MHRRHLDDFIDESKKRQRNIVFPDTVRNGRTVDAYLWKGNPDAPLVQRIGACLIGLFYMAVGLTVLSFIREFLTIPSESTFFERILIVAATLLMLAWVFFWIWLGVRAVRNAFQRNKPSDDPIG